MTNELPDEWRSFNQKFISSYLAAHPDKSKIARRPLMRFLWTVCKGIKKGDIVLCPDGTGRYRVGEVIGDYFYKSGASYPTAAQCIGCSQTIDRPI